MPRAEARAVSAVGRTLVHSSGHFTLDSWPSKPIHILGCARVGYHLAMGYEVGILVHGDNHFIVRGPLPDQATALALTRHWSLIGIGAQTPPALHPWQISSKEFRENLQWAVVVPGEREMSAAVAQLLDELRARGIAIRYPELA